MPCRKVVFRPVTGEKLAYHLLLFRVVWISSTGLKVYHCIPNGQLLDTAFDFSYLQAHMPTMPGRQPADWSTFPAGRADQADAPIHVMSKEQAYLPLVFLLAAAKPRCRCSQILQIKYEICNQILKQVNTYYSPDQMVHDLTFVLQCWQPITMKQRTQVSRTHSQTHDHVRTG